MKKTPRGIARTAFVAITLLWIVSMAALIRREYASPSRSPSPSPSDQAQALSQDYWMGVYMEGEKVGYVHTLLEPHPGEGYALAETVTMRLKMMGADKTMTIGVDALLDDALRVKRFEARVESDFTLAARGEVQGRELVLTMTTGGTESVRRLPLEEVPSLDTAALLELGRAGPGARLEVPVIDPSTMALGKTTMRATGTETLVVMGKAARATVIEGRVQGVEFRAWAAADGGLLKEETAMGLTLMRESREDATNIGRPSLDLVAQWAVPFALPLPEEPSYLRVRLGGTDLAALDLDGGVQRQAGDVVEVRRARLDATTCDGTTPESSAHLAATPTVQSDAPEIRALAGGITREARNPCERARAIYGWVYAEIAKEPTVSIPSALEVLRQRRGDCNEHTVLYTALARAAGVPTRIALGLVYREGAFYYHAWPEAFLGGRGGWVPVDPTLGQYPADAARIRLLTGDLDAEYRLLSVIGRITIEGLEYR